MRERTNPEHDGEVGSVRRGPDAYEKAIFVTEAGSCEIVV